MCYQVKCSNCKKTTWGGCGMHVSSAMRGVADKDRCPNWKMGSRTPCQPGQTAAAAAPTTTTTTPSDEPTTRSAWAPSSWFS